MEKFKAQSGATALRRHGYNILTGSGFSGMRRNPAQCSEASNLRFVISRSGVRISASAPFFSRGYVEFPDTRQRSSKRGVSTRTVFRGRRTAKNLTSFKPSKTLIKICRPFRPVFPQSKHTKGLRETVLPSAAVRGVRNPSIPRVCGKPWWGPPPCDMSKIHDFKDMTKHPTRGIPTAR